MTTIKKLWDDGTELNVQYDGSHAVIRSTPNEGEDRQVVLVFSSAGGKATKELIVKQDGMREQFGDFQVKDGKFLVLKS